MSIVCWTAKLLDAAAINYLFVLVGDGRRWFIPAGAIEAVTGLTLGGSEYAEFEIEATAPVLPLICSVGPPALDSLPGGGAPE